MEQLECEVRLAGAGAVGWEGTDDVGDRLDRVLEVLRLGFVVGRANRPLQPTSTERTIKKSGVRKAVRKVGAVDSLGRTNPG